jgi:hypothetical protein
MQTVKSYVHVGCRHKLPGSLRVTRRPRSAPSAPGTKGAIRVERASRAKRSNSCRRRDSNPHTRRHRNLNPACLPVPPLRQYLLPRSFYCLIRPAHSALVAPGSRRLRRRAGTEKHLSSLLISTRRRAIHIRVPSHWSLKMKVAFELVNVTGGLDVVLGDRDGAFALLINIDYEG